jgi:glycerate 2-kinase
MLLRYEEIHNRIQHWYRAAIKVVEPKAAVAGAVLWDGETLVIDGRSMPVGMNARVIVIAIGKAAAAMAEGAVEVLGDRIDDGIVLTKYGHLGIGIHGFHCFEAGHSIPDASGVQATRSIIDALEGLTSDDVVLALISGGGSALLELPREPLTLQDLQKTTETLMHAGAGIHDLNAVRSVLSQVKGGGLRRHMGGARCVSLLLSDVLGNDPEVIASGPTVLVHRSIAEAQRVASRFGVENRLPKSVRSVLSGEDRMESIPDSSHDVWAVIADNAAMVKELHSVVGADGLSAHLQWHAYDGNATELGRKMVEDALASDDTWDVLLGGGEATVEVTGQGSGGRNTEATLVSAVALEQKGGDWVIASLASDGDDGSAQAAGAIADPETVARGQLAGAEPATSLANNDSATYFRKAGGLVVTGPTGTNVNDVYIAVRIRPALDRGKD